MIAKAQRWISYPAILAGLFILWPVVAYMGGQGFTALVGLAALPVLYFAQPKSVPPYALAFIAFILWAMLSTLWSPEGDGLFSGSLSEGSFAISADALRIGLSALAMGAVTFAMRHVSVDAPRSCFVLRTVPAVQAAGVIVTVLAMEPILHVLAPYSDPETEMPQNLMRNANALTLLLPLLLAWLWQGGEKVLRSIAALLVVTLAWAVYTTGSEAAVMALIGMSAAMLVVWRFQKTGLSALFAFTAGYILLAPLIMTQIKGVMRIIGIDFPLSSWSRAHAWQAVGDRIQEAPLAGHGLEASKRWDETFATKPAALEEIVKDTNPDWVWQAYQIIPGHPHNMPLQIWAETGLIGAVLAAGTCLLVSLRLYQVSHIPPIARYAGAGLFGACLIFFSFSYSMWNDAFWSSVALATAAVLLFGRQTAQS
ncbi:O-antigen ligase family protein [Hyphomonas sp. FCG-A18]|uniref:O-antigen ligase family protein n=1 Tax=Hyphomonas sp. FCG-A18 TaxID=3080019 RepID=UPI002B2F5DC0|nr:O-antigen ligase family protein [Hyphomonas sp. FCG-A18]